MSPQRARMIDSMILAGLAEGTQKLYVQAVRRLAAHYHRPPDRLSEEEVRSYLLGLRQRGVARGTFQTAHYGLRSSSTNIRWAEPGGYSGKKRIGLPRQKRLPDALAEDQVRHLLGGIRNPVHKTCLAVMYACGLRISEATTLEVGAIDRANQVLRIVGKGDKERLVPLPQPVLDELGRLWRTHRNPRWLFPNRHVATRRSTSACCRNTFAAAAAAAGIQRKVTPHTLRHSLCHSVDRERRRHPHRADPTRPRQHRDDSHLHPPDHANPGVAAGSARSADDRPLRQAVMIEIADVFRRFAADYLNAHGASMQPSHRRAIEDILDCRTAALGGQVWRCEACSTEVFSYHSCGNRSCPKCHTAQTQEWLERRQAEMLPVPYFHITVTVPAELRAVLRAHQRDGYGVLMQADAARSSNSPAIRVTSAAPSACSPCCTPGTQQLNLHPHVHCLVSGGGISDDASTCSGAQSKCGRRAIKGGFRRKLRLSGTSDARCLRMSARSVRRTRDQAFQRKMRETQRRTG